MLRVEKIEFIDSESNTYTINRHQIESFPLVGGTDAEIIVSKVWNQHGNTPINALMQSVQENLIFALYTADLTPTEIENKRRLLTNVCNPLNGTITMKVTLNSGNIYNKDITFIAAPSFPTGRENRNNIWQKVLLEYESNNPFWYAEQELVETFQAVQPLFIFPFTMSVADPMLMGNILPSNIAINGGQVAAPVIIKIIGACTNPRIDNLTTGEFLKFNNLTMTANQVLEIDTTFGEKKVTLDGANIFNKLDYASTFFNLVLGANEIEFTDDTGSTTAAIHFIYKEMFITI
jgi:hypothetical protein